MLTALCLRVEVPAAVELPPPGPAALVEVIDGDTVIVRFHGNDTRVRLHGIDAPERRQAHGLESAQALRALLAGGTVQVVPRDRDRNRIVAVVYEGERDIGATLVRQGDAWAYRYFLGTSPREAIYCDFEAEARAARRGLWTGDGQRWLAPWDYRNQRKQAVRNYAHEQTDHCRAAIGRQTPLRTGRCQIKGNINGEGRRLYHLPDSPAWPGTLIDPERGERWFCSEAEAREEGWEPALRPRSGA